MKKKDAVRYLNEHNVELRIGSFQKFGATVFSIMHEGPRLRPGQDPMQRSWCVAIHSEDRIRNIDDLIRHTATVPLGSVMFTGTPLAMHLRLDEVYTGHWELEKLLSELSKHFMATDPILRRVLATCWPSLDR